MKHFEMTRRHLPTPYNDRKPDMTRESDYLELAETFHELPEEHRLSRLLMLEFVADCDRSFGKLRTAVRLLKAGI